MKPLLTISVIAFIIGFIFFLLFIRGVPDPLPIKEVIQEKTAPKVLPVPDWGCDPKSGECS